MSDTVNCCIFQAINAMVLLGRYLQTPHGTPRPKGDANKQGCKFCLFKCTEWCLWAHLTYSINTPTICLWAISDKHSKNLRTPETNNKLLKDNLHNADATISYYVIMSSLTVYNSCIWMLFYFCHSKWLIKVNRNGMAEGRGITWCAKHYYMRAHPCAFSCVFRKIDSEAWKLNAK